jgi:sulfur-oxidizing protein SoxY
MKTIVRRTVVLGLLFASLAAGTPAMAETPDMQPDSPLARENRWRDLEKSVFDGRTATPDSKIVALEAPIRAEDASLVPMTITLGGDRIKELYLIIDDNPAPVAAHFIFGPAGDSHLVKLRVRVNSYTNVHAVAVLPDGRLVEDVKFVKASGGCSAPMGASDEEATKGMGEMRLKFSGVAPGAPAEATLMVKHPNFNGMQMNQVTRMYTPARFIDRITVKDGGALVFDLEASLSLATNPVLSFNLNPQSTGPVTVEVHDTDGGHWRQDFAHPSATN